MALETVSQKSGNLWNFRANPVAISGAEQFAFEMVGNGLEKAFEGIEYFPGVKAGMRDGVQLAADIYRPEGKGPFPVLLMRQPYGRDIASTPTLAHPTYFARRGYIVVIQDVRGRGDSEGEFYPLGNEIEDGYDSVMWAAGLEKSNGKVGMYGFSFMGYAQLQAAIAHPEPLLAIAPMMSAFDWYHGWFYRDGILQLSSTLYWGNQMLREEAARRGAESYGDLEESWRNFGASLSYAMPLLEARPITNPDLPGFVGDWLRHSAYDDYWLGFDLLRRADEFDIPMFHVAGWYDFFLRGTIDGYRSMEREFKKRMRGEESDQFLLVGPWVHMPWGDSLSGRRFGDEARPDIDRLLGQWFDYWLKERKAGDRLRGVRYFAMGSNSWRSASAWPPEEAKEMEFFLVSKGKANSRFGDGVLEEKPCDCPEDLYNYDPEVPVLAPGGNEGGATLLGPFDQSAAQEGNNLLVYTSAPFAKPLLAAGRPRCRLFVKSSAPETDFIVRLTHVLKDESAIFLTLGGKRLSKAKQAVGGVSEIEIELDDTACCFAEGERIRIDIASSAFPLMIRNPNTGVSPEKVASPAEFRRALQVVYHNARFPSVLYLPRVRPDAAKAIPG